MLGDERCGHVAVGTPFESEMGFLFHWSVPSGERLPLTFLYNDQAKARGSPRRLQLLVGILFFPPSTGPSFDETMENHRRGYS